MLHQRRAAVDQGDILEGLTSIIGEEGEYATAVCCVVVSSLNCRVGLGGSNNKRASRHVTYFKSRSAQMSFLCLTGVRHQPTANVLAS